MSIVYTYIRYFLFGDHIIICVGLISYRRIPRQKCFIKCMQDQIISWPIIATGTAATGTASHGSHTCIGGHMDVNC